MLLDISAMAPKGLKKLEELLNAKKEVIDKWGDKQELVDNATQLQAAKKLVDLAMPQNREEEQQGSLVGAVIQIVNNDASETVHS
jgi:hypothetical protein